MFDIKQKTQDYMSLVLTHECNKRCQFCVDAYRGSGETISLDHVQAAIDFGKIRGVRDMLLIGGEPTLHPMIGIIASMVKDAGFRCIVTTNYTRPDVVKSLDGIVDCFNISFYNQMDLPHQVDFESDLTLHTLIHGRQLDTKEKLDRFIDDHSANGNLKFSTLLPCNQWAKRHQQVDYLNNLNCEWVVLFNEILGQIYRESTIKRYDRIINNHARQSYKAHVDGIISKTWERNFENTLLQ